jgi:hypothetical protein
MEDFGDEALEIVQEVGDDNDEGILDDGKEAHDKEAINSVKKQAIQLAETDFRLTVEKPGEQDALLLFLKVSLCTSLFIPH